MTCWKYWWEFVNPDYWFAEETRLQSRLQSAYSELTTVLSDLCNDFISALPEFPLFRCRNRLRQARWRAHHWWWLRLQSISSDGRGEAVLFGCWELVGAKALGRRLQASILFQLKSRGLFRAAVADGVYRARVTTPAQGIHWNHHDPRSEFKYKRVDAGTPAFNHWAVLRGMAHQRSQLPSLFSQPQLHTPGC